MHELTQFDHRQNMYNTCLSSYYTIWRSTAPYCVILHERQDEEVNRNYSIYMAVDTHHFNQGTIRVRTLKDKQRK